MKTTIILTTGLLVAMLTATGAAAAEPGPDPELAISAFADMLMPLNADAETDAEFRVNQAELDLEGAIAGKASAAMAMAYDAEAETFALAVLAAEYTLAEGDDSGASLMAGQFDVRFGLDWRVYASIDRRFVTAPLTTNGTHEGWNDLGINLNLHRRGLEADLFVLNGDGAGRGAAAKVLVDQVGIKRAVGGRVGGMFGRFGAGASAAFFHDESDAYVANLLGVDLQGTVGPVSLRGEYLVETADRGTPSESETSDWYVQGVWELDRLFAFARWDGIDCGCDDGSDQRRYSLGGGWIVENGLEIRLEHEVGAKSLPNRTWLQMAVSFGALGG